MAFTSNIAAINAANRALKTAGFAADAATLKDARAKHFKIEKVEGEWHALIIEPLPEPQAQASAIAGASPEQAEPSEPSKEQIVAEARQSHLIGAPEQSPNAGQAAFASAAAFFASRPIPQAPINEQISPEGSTPDDGASDEDDEDRTGEHYHESMGEAAFERAQAQADAQANAQQATSQLKNGKVWIHASSCESPVKRVWAIADAMIAQAANATPPLPRPSRKEIQDECVRQGVASGTARTQYQAWKKANDNDAANAQRAAELSAALNGRSKQ